LADGRWLEVHVNRLYSVLTRTYLPSDDSCI